MKEKQNMMAIGFLFLIVFIYGGSDRVTDLWNAIIAGCKCVFTGVNETLIIFNDGSGIIPTIFPQPVTKMIIDILIVGISANSFIKTIAEYTTGKAITPILIWINNKVFNLL